MILFWDLYRLDRKCSGTHIDYVLRSPTHNKCKCMHLVWWIVWIVIVLTRRHVWSFYTANLTGTAHGCARRVQCRSCLLGRKTHLPPNCLKVAVFTLFRYFWFFDIFDSFDIFEIVITHKMRWLDVNADFNMDYVFRCGIWDWRKIQC